MAKYICNICGYIYDEAVGIPEKGIPANTKFDSLPEDWKCPLCGASKSDFSLLEEKTESTETTTKIEKILDNEEKLSIAELSALCSNMARSCEKQYKMEESKKFSELSAYFDNIIPKEDNANVQRITELLNEDLQDKYKESEIVCKEEEDRGALRAHTWSKKVTTMISSLLKNYQENGEKMFEGKSIWICTICGFIYVGEKLPEVCPVCKVPNFRFEKIGGQF